MSKRQPIVTQQRLLDVAADIVAEQGANALTLDAVAVRAGVSKGGLLHHFGSKAALIAAVARDLSARFDDAVKTRAAADPQPHGRTVRAYARTVAEESALDRRRWAAFLAAFTNDPRQFDMACATTPEAGDPIDPELALIVQLAADGLWFASMFDLYSIDEATRARIAARLIAMTGPRGASEA